MTLGDLVKGGGVRGLKRAYVTTMQWLGHTRPLFRLTEIASRAQPYGWTRWSASLLAIYDLDGMIRLQLPWWNVAATKEVEAFLAQRPEAEVFEYGAGASTVWLANRTKCVVTAEHDEAWAEKIRDRLRDHDNVVFLQRPIVDGGEEYSRAIHEPGSDFDIIVIDGRHRARCLREARSRLKPGGMIVFDDSGRARYRSSIAESGLNERHHFGRSFCVPYPDHTSILRERA